MRILNTLYVTKHRQTIRYERGTLLVVDAETQVRQRIPLSTLDSLVLTGYGQITTQAITECVRRGIRVVALSKGGRVRFACGGPISGNVNLRVAQIDRCRDMEAAIRTAQLIVAGKIQNCRRLLRRWSWDAPPQAQWSLRNAEEVLHERLINVSGHGSMDVLRGIEGDATRRYFQGMRAMLGTTTTMRMGSRSRRPPRDAVNAALSYVYGLLTMHAEAALDAVGLDPQIGFLHGIRPGRPSLALDLIEEFRPALADRFVVAVLRRRQVTEDDFVTSPGGAVWLTDEGRRRLLDAFEDYKANEVPHPLLQQPLPRWSLVTTQATLMARFVRGDLPDYPPYVMAA